MDIYLGDECSISERYLDEVIKEMKVYTNPETGISVIKLLTSMEVEIEHDGIVSPAGTTKFYSAVKISPKIFDTDLDRYVSFEEDGVKYFEHKDYWRIELFLDSSLNCQIISDYLGLFAYEIKIIPNSLFEYDDSEFKILDVNELREWGE